MERGPSAVAISSVFTAFAGLFVAMRLVCRLGIRRTAGSDDGLTSVAIACSIVLTALIAAQEKHGLGQHFSSLGAGEFPKMMKLFWASIFMYSLGLTTIKASCILQLLRFILDGRVRTLCWVLLTFICIFGTIGIVGTGLACMPIARFWNRTVPGHCMNLLAFWYFCAGVTIMTDIFVVAIPLSVLKSLQLPRRQKVGLLMVFALGGFACIVSVLRLHSIYIVAKSTDITWDNVGAATWSAVELNTGIICACLPTLKPMINKISPRLLGSFEGSYPQHSLEYIPNSTSPQRYQGPSLTLPGRKSKHNSWQKVDEVDEVDETAKSGVRSV